MTSPGVLYNFDYCKTCLSNDYEIQGSTWVRKKPLVTSTLPLDVLPVHIQKQIFLKMNQETFFTMRSVNRRYRDFFNKNRRKLKIALFHNWVIVVRDFHRLCFEPPRNFIPVNTVEQTIATEGLIRHIPYIPVADLQFLHQSSKSIFRKDVILNLLDWNKKKETWKRELTGMYHPSLIVVNGHVEEQQSLYELLEFIHVENVHILFNNASIDVIMKFSPLLKPKALTLKKCNGIQENIFVANPEAFLNLRQLTCYNSDIVNPDLTNHLTKLTFYQIDSACTEHLIEVKKLLKLWYEDKAALRELVVGFPMEIHDILEHLPVVKSERTPGWHPTINSLPPQEAVCYKLESKNGLYAGITKSQQELHFKAVDT